MKKTLIFMVLISFLLCSTNSYAERIYISRLSDVNLHISQSGTGPYALDNCGPTSLAMILEYLVYPYNSVALLRSKIRNFGGWVYTNEIEDYLCINNIPYEIIPVGTEDDLIQTLSNGGIILVCLNISYVAVSTNSNIGRDYSGGTGHYLVISGYYKNDTECYFEVLDPRNKQVRYYKSTEIINAITSWWPWSIIFYKERFNNVY